MDSERFDAYVKALFAGRLSRRLIATGLVAGATGVPLAGATGWRHWRVGARSAGSTTCFK